MIRSTLKKYAGLYLAFFKASLAADIEFRANFATRILTDIFWYVAQIAAFEVIYKYTPRIGDWNAGQTRVFLGMLFVVDAFYMIIFSENLDKLNDKVKRGHLDLLLTKPVNSQFMISCQRLTTAIFGNLLLGSAWLVWALSRLPDFSWPRLLWMIVLIPCGLIALYSMKFFFVSCVVIFTGAEGLQYLWYQIYRLGMRPDSIYYPWMKYLVLTAIPVGMIASVPARFLLEAPNLPLFAWTLFVTWLALKASNLFWKYSLRFYSSASS